MAALLLPVLLACAPPQDPAILARYQMLGQEAVVVRDDVALEMAFHLRRKDEGRAACDHLVSATLVQKEAEAKGLMPKADEVQDFWNKLQQQLRASGKRPEEIAVVKNSGEQLLQDLAVQLAHERLVRKELELRADETVGPEMLKLWLQEAKKRHHVVDDPDQLPLGTAARYDDQTLSLVDLGNLLLRTSDVDDQLRFVRQVVVLQTLEAMAGQHGIDVTADELQRELAQRRDSANADPRYQGIGYDQLLKAQGLTADWLLHSRVFRGQVLQQKLVAKLHPLPELLAKIAADRQHVLDTSGPRRRLSVIYARALKEPNPLVPRTFAQAMAELAQVRERLQHEPFDRVAMLTSDDPASKQRGGDLGWFFRKNPGLPEPVLAAAFAQQRNEISMPLRCDDGCYLVKVVSIEPDPTDEELAVRMREQLVEDLTPEILQQAKLQLESDASKTAGKRGK